MVKEIATSTGLLVNDTNNSLKAGSAGPTLTQDFHFRDKMSHFDHERIPERVVHARGVAAKGYFESYADISNLSKAGVFKKGEKTEVFVRFSTVLGSRGSADTVRDVRGFAVKFYTKEGNWDLVGNNIPVFFIQDAIKFPDIIHAGKPHPHNEIHQAMTAHDNFWDLISLLPEATHMISWILSDRTLPRSLSMMEGFGVHTFRLVNAKGESTFVKFHWKPKRGVHSLTWDECLKLNGQDPDFHRKDLTENIEAGCFPEWDLGIQVISQEQADKFDFDILDATKLVPEEICPVKLIGKMVLNENVANYFQETEQVAFCTSHIVPGIDHSNDPLLQGRNFSYHDTQLSRLGGINFNQIPVNRPKCPVENNQQGGFHRDFSMSRSVNYFPNRFGCPALAGNDRAFVDFPTPVQGVVTRERNPRFNEHTNQAKMFYNSLSDAEKGHFLDAAKFELGHVHDSDISKNVLENILSKINVDMAKQVAEHLGLDIAFAADQKKVQGYKSLSQMGASKYDSVQGKKIALLVTSKDDCNTAIDLIKKFKAAGITAVPISERKLPITKSDVDVPSLPVTYHTHTSVLFDAGYVVGDSSSKLGGKGHTFVEEAKGHGKVVAYTKVTDVNAFIESLKTHRSWTKATPTTTSTGFLAKVESLVL